MNGIEWAGVFIIVIACLCFFSWILARALADRDSAAEISDEEYVERMERHREKQLWP